MHTALKLTSLVTASLVVAFVFVSSTSYPQLAIAILLYIPLAYIIFKALPRKTQREILPMVTTQPRVEAEERVEAETVDPKRESVAIVDIDKRAFLKLIGGLGLTAFLISIFNKKTGNIFSGTASVPETISLKNAAGNKINPMEHQPTDGYRISEIDDSATAFYGFTNKDDAWFIMKEDSDTGSFRYTRGDRNFPGNWDNRENLRYDYFNNVFKA